MREYDLLINDIFRVQTRSSGTLRMPLPSLLASLAQNDVISLPGLRSHQEDIFHIFLCYLSAAVLDRANKSEISTNAGFWRTGLELLAGNHSRTAWLLVEQDHTLPAFLQPAWLTSPNLKVEIEAYSADKLDVLQTAKNHDVKSDRANKAELDSWVYALVCLQTSSGYPSPGHYGIARMNSGSGSRPCVTLLEDSTTGSRFCRDVNRLLELRPNLLSDRWAYSKDGTVLTWLEPWSGSESLGLSQLDPFFIEICRLVRIVEKNENLVAVGRTTQTNRIAAKDLKGVIGDPWTPIKLESVLKSLTVSEAGFTPKLLRDLIFEDGFEMSQMQVRDSSQVGKACIFHASVLVRGQSVTEGFHTIDLPIPGNVANRLFSKSDKKPLQELSKTAINDAGTLEKEVLRKSLFCLLEAGSKKINFDKREVKAWVDSARRHFSSRWSAEFFPWLWSAAEEDHKQARELWLNKLRKIAESVLHNAEASLPLRGGRKYRSRASAEAVFYRLYYKHFPTDRKEGELNGHSA